MKWVVCGFFGGFTLVMSLVAGCLVLLDTFDNRRKTDDSLTTKEG